MLLRLDSFLQHPACGLTYVVPVVCSFWVLRNAALMFYNLLVLCTNDGYLGYFSLGVITDKTAMKQLVYMPFGGHKTRLF